MGAPQNSLPARCLAEGVGTFILVFLGCGVVHVAVLTEAHSGLWQVAIVWGIAVTLAIFVVGGISGAHINPAITVSLAACGRFRWGQVLPYVLAQVAGAFVAAAALFAIFFPFLADKENQKQITRGEPGSEITAMCYGEYFPSPGGLAANAAPQRGTEVVTKLEEQHGRFPAAAAMAAEVLGTLLLALVVFAVTDPRNTAAPGAGLAPAFIGLTVAVLIAVIAPLTQACFNPARDFGPRLFACLAGWGTVALPGPRAHGFVTVYILAPVVGAVAGGGLYTLVLRRLHPVEQLERTDAV
ncbi:MAG TPA: aquaporin [Gemmataceae bacterium]|jgi:glycerol uptake facilitator protein|nr:aquaporin [Gemmataceae bacterium]